MQCINIVRVDEQVKLPQKMTEHSVGFDLFAYLNEPLTLAAGKRALISTGIILDLPEDVYASVKPRSGWALKYGITILNTPGTIDPDYRGEVKVLLINLGEEDVTIKPGDRIGQLTFSRVVAVELNEVDHFKKTTRGDGGYGHTGGL